MEIFFNGTYDKAIINQAVRLMTKPTIWLLLFRVVCGGVLLAGVALTVHLFVIDDPSFEFRLSRTILQSIVLGYFVFQPYIASRRLKDKLSERNTKTANGLANAIGITYNAQIQGREIEIPWRVFARVYKSDNMVVLMTADSKVSMLPRSFFANQDDWNRFLQYVDSRVVIAK